MYLCYGSAWWGRVDAIFGRRYWQWVRHSTESVPDSRVWRCCTLLVGKPIPFRRGYCPALQQPVDPGAHEPKRQLCRVRQRDRQTDVHEDDAHQEPDPYPHQQVCDNSAISTSGYQLLIVCFFFVLLLCLQTLTSECNRAIASQLAVFLLPKLGSTGRLLSLSQDLAHLTPNQVQADMRQYRVHGAGCIGTHSSRFVLSLPAAALSILRRKIYSAGMQTRIQSLVTHPAVTAFVIEQQSVASVHSYFYA